VRTLHWRHLFLQPNITEADAPLRRRLVPAQGHSRRFRQCGIRRRARQSMRDPSTAWPGPPLQTRWCTEIDRDLPVHDRRRGYLFNSRLRRSKVHTSEGEHRCRLFRIQNRRKPRRCHATTVSGLTTCTAERQPRQAWESHAHNSRSADVNRRRGRRDRFTRTSWCRSARIPRCREARERIMNRSE
jgi:hypothetical protein